MIASRGSTGARTTASIQTFRSFDERICADIKSAERSHGPRSRQLTFIRLTQLTRPFVAAKNALARGSAGSLRTKSSIVREAENSFRDANSQRNQWRTSGT